MVWVWFGDGWTQWIKWVRLCQRGIHLLVFLCAGKAVGVRKMEASRVVLVVAGLKKAQASRVSNEKEFFFLVGRECKKDGFLAFLYFFLSLPLFVCGIITYL